MVREFSKAKYFMAFFITGLIFFLGLSLGLVVENRRVESVDAKSKIQELNFNSLQLQYAFLDQLSQEKNCNAFTEAFDENIKDMEATRIKLEEYANSANIAQEDFDILKRMYVQSEIRYWLLSLKYSELCNKPVNHILYFFSDEKECPTCNSQSFVLTYLKKEFDNNLLNFAFDSKLSGESLIDLFKATYQINTYPTLIINGKKFSGFQSKDQILKEICPTIKNATNSTLCTKYN